MPETPTALITGTSSGLGEGLARALLQRDGVVYGCSRRPSRLAGLKTTQLDLTDHDAIGPSLDQLLDDAPRLDLVVLNAGVLGEIRDPVDQLQQCPAKWIREILLFYNRPSLSGRSTVKHRPVSWRRNAAGTWRRMGSAADVLLPHPGRNVFLNWALSNCL